MQSVRAFWQNEPNCCRPAERSIPALFKADTAVLCSLEDHGRRTAGANMKLDNRVRMPALILKRASASRPSGEWSDDGGLSETGYAVGRDVTVEARMAEGQYDRLHWRPILWAGAWTCSRRWRLKRHSRQGR